LSWRGQPGARCSEIEVEAGQLEINHLRSRSMQLSPQRLRYALLSVFGLILAVTPALIPRLKERAKAYETEAERIAGVKVAHLEKITELRGRIAEFDQLPNASVDDRRTYRERRNRDIATEQLLADLLGAKESDYRVAASKPWQSRPRRIRQPLEESEAIQIAGKYLAKEFPYWEQSKCTIDCDPYVRDSCREFHWRVYFSYPTPGPGSLWIDVAPDGNCDNIQP
jgi:hypothetical protein